MWFSKKNKEISHFFIDFNNINDFFSYISNTSDVNHHNLYYTDIKAKEIIKLIVENEKGEDSIDWIKLKDLDIEYNYDDNSLCLNDTIFFTDDVKEIKDILSHNNIKSINYCSNLVDKIDITKIIISSTSVYFCKE